MTFNDLEAEKQIDLMRQMINKSPVAKVVMNKDLKITTVNRKLCEETHYHPYELINECVTKILKEENYDLHIEAFNDWFENPKEMRLQIAEQLYTVGKDGHETPVRIDVYPLEDWQKNNMIQLGSEISKPTILACLAIVLDAK